MNPRANHYDPKGQGSLLQVGDTLNLSAVMFPYVDNDGDIQWALGLSNKTQAELDALATQASAASDKDAKRKVLGIIKTLAFSSLCRKSVITDKDGNVVDFQITGSAAVAVNAIPVDSTTTEASFAQQWAITTAGKTAVKAVGDMIATSQSGRKYRRVNVVDLV